MIHMARRWSLSRALGLSDRIPNGTNAAFGGTDRGVINGAKIMLDGNFGRAYGDSVKKDRLHASRLLNVRPPCHPFYE